MEKFNPYEDPSKLGQNWVTWKRYLEHYLVLKKIKTDSRKLSTLLFMAGTEVQRIYEQKKAESDFDEDIHLETYELAITLLDLAFVNKRNDSFQRTLFRQLTQGSDETIMAFVTRLRAQAEFCGFEDEESVEKAMKDQILEKGKSDKLRKEMWKEDRDWRKMLMLAQSLENAEIYEKTFRGKKALADVNQVESASDWKRTKEDSSSSLNLLTKEKICWSCNKSGHLRFDPKCPARNMKCVKCDKKGHFSICCRQGKSRGARTTSGFKSKRVHQIDEMIETESESEEYVFNFDDGKSEEVTCDIGGVKIKMIIDSGTQRNLIPMTLWNDMKKEKVKIIEQIEGSDVKLKAYGQENDIPIQGRFKAIMKVNSITSEQWFYVVRKGNACLMGKPTAIKHNVLKIGLGVMQ